MNDDDLIDLIIQQAMEKARRKAEEQLQQLVGIRIFDPRRAKLLNFLCKRCVNKTSDLIPITDRGMFWVHGCKLQKGRVKGQRLCKDFRLDKNDTMGKSK